MPRTRHITTLEQTSIGANGFRLQYWIKSDMYETCHAHFNGKKDVDERKFFTNETEAKRYYHVLVANAIEKQKEIDPQKSYPLITKII